MNHNRLRPYTTVTMIVSMVLLALTGLLLYLAPHGPGSRYWTFLGIHKHQYGDIHLCLSVVVMILVCVHGFLNFKALSKYFKFQQKSWIHPLLFASVIIFFTLVVAFSF